MAANWTTLYFMYPQSVFHYFSALSFLLLCPLRYYLLLFFSASLRERSRAPPIFICLKWYSTGRLALSSLLPRNRCAYSQPRSGKPRAADPVPVHYHTWRRRPCAPHHQRPAQAAQRGVCWPGPSDFGTSEWAAREGQTGSEINEAASVRQ